MSAPLHPDRHSTPPYPQAVILAGGRATRFQALGEVLPKCLLPVYDKPLLIRQIEQCALAGVGDVLVSVAQRFAATVQSVLDLYRPPAGVAVTCIAEPRPLGPVGGVLALLPEMGDRATLLLLGDEYYESSSPFRELASRGQVADLVVGLVRHSPAHRIQCNVVTDPAGRIVDLREKPAVHQLQGSTRWCGCAGFRGGLLASLTLRQIERCAHSGDLISQLLAQGAVAEPLEFPEIHINLNSPEDLLLASLVAARDEARRNARPALSALDAGVAALLVAGQPPTAVRVA